MGRNVTTHSMKLYLCTLSKSWDKSQKMSTCYELHWGVKCLCACIFPLPSSKNIDFKAVLQNTTNSKDIWRNVGGSLTPDVLRVASLGHQFLDVLCCLGAGHATELLGYLVESSLYVPCHVTCISGRKSAFNSPFAVDI